MLRPVRWRPLTLPIALGLALLGCKDPVEPPTTATPRPAPLSPAGRARPVHVRFAGCDQAGPGPVCILTTDQRSLVLWADVMDARDVQLRLDDEDSTAVPEPVVGGLRWTLEVPVGTGRLELVHASESAAPIASVTLRTEDHPVPPSLLEIQQTAEQDLERAQAQFERERDRWHGVDRVHAQMTAGALAFRARDFAAVRKAYAEGIAQGQQQERWSDAQRMALTLAFLCIEDRDFRCGRRWLERDAALAPFSTVDHLYDEGLLAAHRGDLGAALTAYRQALRDTRALGQGLKPKHTLANLGQLMLLMAQVGDRAGAREAMQLGLQTAYRALPQHRASFLNTAAWSILITPATDDRRSWSPYPPRMLLDRARQLLGENPEGKDAWLAVRLNLALEALERGEPTVARGWLDALSDHELTRHDALWRRLMEARIEQLEGALDSAGRHLDALGTEAERHQERGVHWATRVAKARGLEQQGRNSAALDEYAAADRLIERWLPLLGLSDWERFSAGRDEGTRRRVALLSATGDDQAALCVARLARTRSLRAIHGRLRRDVDPRRRQAFDDYLREKVRLDAAYEDAFWNATGRASRRQRKELERDREHNEQQFESLMRSEGSTAAEPECASLSTPPSGTVDLHYVRLDADWVGWSMDAHGTVTHAALRDVLEGLESGDPTTLGRALLDPFAEDLDAATRVRVMATGALHEVPFHALAFGDPTQRLQDHAVVVYGLDLPGDAHTGTGSGPALVLEPTSNLPRAHQEARASASGLRAQGATVEWLEDQVTAESPLVERVVEALPRASWLHYVGHARADGVGRWNSELMLASDGTMALGVSQILALPAVPRVVVLSGCETGVVDPASAGGGMSLAHAFVLAGAEVAIATTENVRDDQAVELMDDLYGSLSGLDPASVELALRTAQQRAAAQSGADRTAAWHLVRAWVP